MPRKSHKLIVRWPPAHLPESLEVAQEGTMRSHYAANAGFDMDFGPGVVWHGTAVEGRELQAVINRECAESPTPCADDWINDDCVAHSLLNDQAALDRLVMVRRMAVRLATEEGVAGRLMVRSVKVGRPRTRKSVPTQPAPTADAPRAVVYRACSHGCPLVIDGSGVHPCPHMVAE